jgi:oligoribonuclease NrnB/cAMP/cGMP phosphodiesterase (DHH superfamily)
MSLTINKPLVIYHKNCADGVASAWCFWKYFKEDMEYFPGVYQEPPPDIFNRDVYLVDFSYKRDVMDMICRYANKVTLIDHHQSALKDLEGLEDKWDNFNSEYSSIEESGCALTWRYVKDLVKHKDPRPSLIDHIEDRDLWKFQIEHTREIMMSVFSYELTVETLDTLMAYTKDNLMYLVREGQTLIRKYESDLKRVIKSATREFPIGGYKVPCCNCNSLFTSDVGNQLAPDDLFAATYYDTATKRIFSLRSTKEGLDVSEIAKSYGGGGHRHAAGFVVDRTHDLAKF